jgi:hypothetical protein
MGGRVVFQNVLPQVSVALALSMTFWMALCFGLIPSDPGASEGVELRFGSARIALIAVVVFAVMLAA